MTPFEMIRIIILGLAIAAPVGPISVHCMKTTIRSGLSAGICAGLGAALADGTVCLAAMSGLGNFTCTSELIAKSMNFIAFIFLTWLAVETLKGSSEIDSAEMESKSGAQSFLSTFFYTALNPITLLTFVAVFCGAESGSNAAEYVLIASLCIFIGSAIWWLSFAAILSLARGFLSPGLRKWINVASSMCILTFALKVLFAA